MIGEGEGAPAHVLSREPAVSRLGHHRGQPRRHAEQGQVLGAVQDGHDQPLVGQGRPHTDADVVVDIQPVVIPAAVHAGRGSHSRHAGLDDVGGEGEVGALALER